MQLHLKFTGKGIVVPIAYQHLVQGMLYEGLRGDPVYRHFLHETGFQVEDRAFRHYVFGQLRGYYDYDRDAKELSFPEGVSLEIRSTEGRFIQCLLEGLRRGSVHRLGQNKLTVADIRLTDRHVTKGEIRLIMDSPITVHRTRDDRSTVFPDPFDPEFNRLLRVNAARKWISLYNTDPPGSLGIAPLAVSEQDKIVTTFKCFASSTESERDGKVKKKKDFDVTGWRGRYLLWGEPQMLDMLYQTGLGNRNAQGFGLFNLI